MGAEIERPLFTFRVLAEFDSEYNVYVARCLETGSVASADDMDTVLSMIEELLVDEVTFAIENDNLANLYSSPAPLRTWEKYRTAIRGSVPAKPMQREIRARDKEMPAEIQIASAA